MIMVTKRMGQGGDESCDHYDEKYCGRGMKMVILMVRRMRMMTIIKGKLFADKKHLKRKREGWPLRGLKSCQSSHI